jgi:predicted P-loop ATPase
MRFAYHPIRQYIGSTQWDGVKRLDTWLHKYCGAADNAYTAAVGRKTIVAAIARVFDPGHKFDYCLVLEGDQGIGKSTVCAIFGGKWYGDIILDPHSRDTIDMMRGKWFIELSEMEVTRRSDVQALKAFVSRTSDRTRLAYARSADDFPRQCIFIGTINPDGMGYLSDTTGNRRFWPIKCGAKIDMAGLKGVRDQILAEALVMYKRHEELFLAGDVLKYAEIEQSERMCLDPWKDAILSWLDGPGAEVSELTVAQIWELVLGGAIKSITRGDQTRIGRIFTELGWYKYRPVRGGSQTKVYAKPIKK